LSQNIIPSIKNVSKHQSSHYRNISTDLLGTGRAFLGIRGAYFGNHCLKERRRYWDLKEEVLGGNKCQLDATDEFLLYKWLLSVVFGAWFSSCRYSVELRVVSKYDRQQPLV
jgi:hypothetical protein